MEVRTRFAPSPTGYLHVGSARTALYCWLYAKKHHGKFILRIEDTDQERSTAEFVDIILESMTWLGLQQDEGPFYQTKRLERYAEVAQQLLTEGKAYRCYCSKERLETLRAEQMARKEKPRYDGHCRDRDLSETKQSYVIRFRNPQAGEVIVDDQVRGRVIFKNTELDDLIIARSDGVPTYNFTVVVDDWDMKVTHVIRGDDHLNNTPRQMNILAALGATLPIYSHIPMILGNDGKRLSKRHGAVGVLQYRDDGYLPEALLNYLVRLGWSHGDQEIFSTEEMINFFDLKQINRSPAAFNNEKLIWLNQHYLKTSDPAYVAKHLRWHMEKLGVNLAQGPNLIDIVLALRERAKTLHEMAEKSQIFYQDVVLSEGADPLPAELLPAIATLQQRLQICTDWTDDALHHLIAEVAETNQLKLGQLAQPLRIIVTGGTVSPPINTTLRLLGKNKVLERIDASLALK